MRWTNSSPWLGGSDVIDLAGCSYRQLLDGIRECHAIQLLADPSLTRRDVAFLLGYAEQSAFNHAAQRWRASSLAQIIKT